MKKVIKITVDLDEPAIKAVPKPEKPAAIKCRKHKVYMDWVWSKRKRQYFPFHDHEHGYRCWGNGYESNYQGIK